MNLLLFDHLIICAILAIIDVGELTQVEDWGVIELAMFLLHGEMLLLVMVMVQTFPEPISDDVFVESLAVPYLRVELLGRVSYPSGSVAGVSLYILLFLFRSRLVHMLIFFGEGHFKLEPFSSR